MDTEFLSGMRKYWEWDAVDAFNVPNLHTFSKIKRCVI